jgi:death-on-curing family protein
VRTAREEAEAVGEPSLAPPTPLEDCPDRHTIEMALAAPRAGYLGYERYSTFQEKAAVLLYSLAKSQGCRDGNKRVALILVMAFLHINGARLETTDDELAAMIIDAAESERRERDDVIIRLVDWFKAVLETTDEEAG